MNKTIMLMGIIFGFLAIVLGAFGAHGLEKVVDSNSIDTFEVGVRYQMYHALFLLFLGSWDGLLQKQKRIVFIFVLLGVLLFSFSIYLLAINSLVAFNFKQIAFVTPIGGTFLIIGWFLLGYYILTKKQHK
ncbi:DUF423 domain-containing protein [Flagellimonas sp. HMM57]|uniref:DUF423 domain-containing protein n=1 Tax=unclassified Flagellimonas TaxID=2644544 RepID=UPI0013D32BEB|nr:MULTISPECIES: DUF423 domain-containing protein [unclassified Flagellimonas]UII74573.1 DUF423 domain-containing protein [Flagellimonas sp. HMM57]